MITSAADLFKAAALRTKVVKVCGHEITIRELSVGARLRLAEADKKQTPSILVQECAVTPDGNPLLTDEETAKLANLSPEFIDGIAGEVLKLSSGKEEKKD